MIFADFDAGATRAPRGDSRRRRFSPKKRHRFRARAAYAVISSMPRRRHFSPLHFLFGYFRRRFRLFTIIHLLFR